jgi:hypothetical protein
MFPDCVLPGCRNPVADHGDACAACTTAFGPMLQPGARITEREITRRDAEVRAAYAMQRATA